MKSGTATARVADTIINKSDCAERILKSFQLAQEKAILEAQEVTRKEVRNSLLSRFNLELTELQLRFDRRLAAVSAQNEALERLKIESAVAAATEALREQTREEAKVAQERITRLEHALEAANAVRTEKADTGRELARKLEEASQAKEQLERDLQRAVSELNSLAHAGAKQEADHAHTEVAAIVESEIMRVRLRIEEIEKAIADPSTSLGFEIRLNRERAELEAYLKGLRYSLGDVSLECSTVGNSAKL